MNIVESIKSWFKQEEPAATAYKIDSQAVEQFIAEDKRRWKSFTDNTEFEGMTETEVEGLIPVELKLNMMGSLAVPEALEWYKHFLLKGVWPTTEEAYFMRYLKGNHKKIPFHILRKFIMEDAGDNVDKEIKLWSHR